MFKIKKVKPMFTGVITTSNCYVGETTTSGGLILDIRKREGSINPYQTVVAVGDMCRDIKEGDIVRINFKRYEVARHVPGAIDEAENVQKDNMGQMAMVPKVEIDGIEYLLIQNNDIEYVVTDYEVDEGGLLQ